MEPRCEVWERRPGGRWEVVYVGSRDAANLFVSRCVARKRGARFTPPVEQVVLPLGDRPFTDTAPSAVVA